MKITRIILYCLLFCFLSPFSLYSQGEWNNWYFGDHAGITFNTSPPSPLLNSGMPTPTGYTISISDSTGSLLFYSNGEKVYNRLHSVMPNGMGLSIGLGNQIVFAVKQSGNNNLYYLFHINDMIPIFFNGMYYSIIDMDLDGGLGDIVPGMKNIPVPGMSDAMDLLTGTRHNNNKDVWLVTKKYLTNQYVSILITSSGISPTIVLSNSNAPVVNVTPNNGDLHISPDGTKLIFKYYPQNDYAAEFCEFDDETGIVTPLFNISPYIGMQKGVTDCCGFSPDSKLLYIMVSFPSPLPSGIFQYNVSVTDSVQVMNSQVMVYQTEPLQPTFNWPFQMGPDWKLYLPDDGMDSLNAINNPNIQGIGCNFQRSAVSLAGRMVWGGLPQFLQKYKAYVHYNKNCDNDSVSFISDIWPTADSIHWDFGDPASGPANFSTLANPSHIYSGPGTYTVELYVRHNDNRTDTSWKNVIIVPTPQPSLGPDRSICIGDSVIFYAGACTGCTYLWKDLITGLPIGIGQMFTTGQAGIYEVAVTNTDGCIGRDTVQLFTSPVPTITNNPFSKSVCSGESTNIVLTSNVPAATFNWTATLTSGNITGFSTDSGLVINQVLVNHIATPGEVTYHITPKIGSCIGSAVDFVVTVNPGDSAKVTITASENNICAGTPVNFTATPVNPGTTPAYQWKVNGANAGTNSSTFSYSPSNGDQVKCILTSSITLCISNNPATSNIITMIVNPNLPVSVSISATPSGAVCSGTSVTFTAIPTNGGTTPQYQWKVNGISVGTNSSTYSYIPVNGDQVKCILTSSEICTLNNPATSNTLSMTINNNLLVGVSISASVNPVCGGIPVTFTALPTNGGSTPQYQWKVNGINVGSNNPVYTYTPASGDQVSCILTSNLTCTSNNPATSNTLTMTINNPPQVTFTRCFDSITTTNGKPIKLKGGIPLGGTYSGPGVNSVTGYLNPAAAGTGTKTITYTYTNSALCSSSNSCSLIIVNSSSFICGNSLNDPRDGKSYPTVQIGSQCWMAANLNYGTEIPSTQHQRDNCIPENYKSAVGSQQSAFYQWDELMRYDDTPAQQGLCPPAWHVPTEAEWNTLFTNWTSNAFAGAPLKYSGYSGFDALLSGVRHLNVQWDYQNFATFFWSSTSHGMNKAWSHGMNDYDYSVSVYPSFRSNAFSVRCLKD